MTDILDRLRGRYPVGHILPSGEPEFGWREFYGPERPMPAINAEAIAEIARLTAERDEARRFGEDASCKYNALIASGPTLTCAFCGEAFPPGTPAGQHELLTAHVARCEKHPMRAVEARLAKAMAALAGLVESSDRAELEQMEAAMRLVRAPDLDKAAALNAIHCLLAEVNEGDVSKEERDAVCRGVVTRPPVDDEAERVAALGISPPIGEEFQHV